MSLPEPPRPDVLVKVTDDSLIEEEWEQVFEGQRDLRNCRPGDRPFMHTTYRWDPPRAPEDLALIQYRWENGHLAAERFFSVDGGWQTKIY